MYWIWANKEDFHVSYSRIFGKLPTASSSAKILMFHLVSKLLYQIKNGKYILYPNLIYFSKIVVPQTLHAVSHLNHFEGFSSVALSIFTLLCNYVQNSYHLIKPQCYFHWTITPVSSYFHPWKLPFYFLSSWIWLFLVPYSTGIRQYLSFCDWLISLNIMSSRFIAS